MPTNDTPSMVIGYYREQLSENFQRVEFACKGHHCCGSSAPINPMLVDILQEIRSHFGVPITINRGFSCVIHNGRIGANITSDHCLGLAADVQIPNGIQVELIRDVAITMPGLGAFGMYDTHFHIAVETAPNKPLREWDDRVTT